MRRASFFIIVGTVLLTAAIAQAQESSGSAGLRLFDHFLVKGGAITWFVLVPLSVATVALTIEYCLSIRRETFLPAATYERLAEQLSARQYADALQFSAEDPTILSDVVNAGLLESANGFSAMERAVEETLEERAARAMRKIEYLNVIGNISPMVGLFGTVYGMIRLFGSIREAGGMPEPARIADEISLALVTTFWGLLVAIPALSIFAIFRNRIDVLTAECAVAADQLLAPFKAAASSAVAVLSAPAGQPPAQGSGASTSTAPAVPQPNPAGPAKPVDLEP